MTSKNIRIRLVERDVPRPESGEGPSDALPRSQAARTFDRELEIPSSGASLSENPPAVSHRFDRPLEPEPPGGEEGRTPEPAGAKPFDRKIEADGELRVDWSDRSVPYHVCRSCGAINSLGMKICDVCAMPIGGAGQREHDIEVHKQREAMFSPVDEEIPDGEEERSPETMFEEIRNDEEADLRSHAARARARLLFLGLALLSCVAFLIFLILADSVFPLAFRLLFFGGSVYVVLTLGLAIRRDLSGGAWY